MCMGCSDDRWSQQKEYFNAFIVTAVECKTADTTFYRANLARYSGRFVRGWNSTTAVKTTNVRGLEFFFFFVTQRLARRFKP